MEWLSLWGDPYVRFGDMLILAHFLPAYIGFRRGAPALSKAAAVAAVAMIAVIAGTLALGIRSLWLLMGAVYYQAATFFAAMMPVALREIGEKRFLYGSLAIAEVIIYSLLQSLLGSLFFK